MLNDKLLLICVWSDVCEITLDQNTAHRNLKLSVNSMKVTTVKEVQLYHHHPERFDSWSQVLCSTGLTGRCYWEVEWKGRAYIAVTYGGIRRKGEGADGCLGGNDHFWMLLCDDDGSYSVRHEDRTTRIRPPSSPSSNRVAVFLDCPAGTLSFYKMASDTLIPLYTFHSTFTEPLYPAFGFGFGYGLGCFSSSVSLCEVEESIFSSCCWLKTVTKDKYLFALYRITNKIFEWVFLHLQKLVVTSFLKCYANERPGFQTDFQCPVTQWRTIFVYLYVFINRLFMKFGSSMSTDPSNPTPFSDENPVIRLKAPHEVCKWKWSWYCFVKLLFPMSPINWALSVKCVWNVLMNVHVNRSIFMTTEQTPSPDEDHVLRFKALEKSLLVDLELSWMLIVFFALLQKAHGIFIICQHYHNDNANMLMLSKYNVYHVHYCSWSSVLGLHRALTSAPSNSLGMIWAIDQTGGQTSWLSPRC